MSILTNETYTNKAVPLGEEILTPTDRVYRYAKNGPAALVAGTVLQGPRPNDSHDNLTCAAAAVGKTFITVTLAAGDPISINDYTDGYIYVNDGAGESYLYDIVSNGGGFGEDSTCSFNIKQQLIVALTTSSQATLVKNPYENVSRPFGDPWDIIVGVAPVAVPADEYFWCQVRGPAAVLQAGGLFAGRGVMLSQWKPGAVEVLKQVVPIEQGRAQGRRTDDTIMPPLNSAPSSARQFQQKGVEQRLPLETLRTEPDEVLTEVAGKATIPERVIGYCINPRVSEEYALVYLTLS